MLYLMNEFDYQTISTLITEVEKQEERVERWKYIAIQLHDMLVKLNPGAETPDYDRLIGKEGISVRVNINHIGL